MKTLHPAFRVQDLARSADFYDPDGHRIELVQWPAGHPVGLTRADFAS